MHEQSRQEESSEAYQEIDLLDYLTLLIRRRWVFIRNIGVACLVAALVSFLLPKKYTAVTTILPPAENQRYDLQKMFPDLSMGPLSVPTINTTAALFVEILKSRSVREGVLRQSHPWRDEHVDLLAIFGVQSIEVGLAKLDRCTSIFASEQGVVTIRVELSDPKLAASVANAYVEVLDRVNQEKSISQAKSSRIYIEEQLKQTESKLQDATQALAEFQEIHKAISLEEQTKAAIESAGELKGQIVAKQIELGTLQLTMKADNPQVIRVQRELEEMQSRYDELQYGNGETLREQKEFYIPIAQLPEVGRQLAELIREVKVQETVWDLLNQQYYQAKIQEARDTPTVQQLDRAVPPEHRSKPRRKLIIVVASLLSGLLTVFWVFGEEYFKHVREREDERRKVEGIGRYFTEDWRKAKGLLSGGLNRIRHLKK